MERKNLGANEGEGEETQLVKPTKTSKLNESLFFEMDFDNDCIFRRRIS